MTIERIRRTIQREHKVTSTHVRSEHVTERLEDRVWYGTVEVFSSIDDPSVVAYGWVADAPDDRERRYVTVLGGPAIRSARDAVRARLAAVRSIVEEARRAWTATPQRRALIVDDYPRLLESLALFVEGVGYEVEAAASGREALARLAACPPDVVVIEVGVRDVDGCDVIRRMKAAAPGLVVIAYTAYPNMQDAARRAGADAIVLKPYVDALEDVLARALTPRPTDG